MKKDFGEEEIQYRSMGVLTIRDRQGTRVSGVLHGSPAAKARLQQGDYLVRINGAPYSFSRLEALQTDR